MNCKQALSDKKKDNNMPVKLVNNKFANVVTEEMHAMEFE